jgi:hypothetical protein
MQINELICLSNSATHETMQSHWDKTNPIVKLFNDVLWIKYALFDMWNRLACGVK